MRGHDLYLRSASDNLTKNVCVIYRNKTIAINEKHARDIKKGRSKLRKFIAKMEITWHIFVNENMFVSARRFTDEDAKRSWL